MQYSRRFLLAALGTAPFASKSQPNPVCSTPSLGALSQRMGKAWLCTANAELAAPAREVLALSQTAFEQQLVQMSRSPASPEQAGSLRALARRYEDYQGLLAGAPGVEGQRALLSTANEMLTLAQLANAARAALPWQARLASRQRLLSQRVALLGLASQGVESARRERQATVYEFEAGLQTLRGAADAALREQLALADAAWMPLKDGVGSGRPVPVFVASERLLTVMDAVTEHCARMNT
jgi:hypothetical protein